MASKKYYKKNACCVVHSRLLRVFAHLRSLQASTWNEKKNGKQLMQNSKMIMRISSTESRFVRYFCAWSSQCFFCSIFNWHFFESSENNEHFPCVSCEFRGKSFSIFPRDISPSDKQTFCIGNKQKKNQSYAKLCKMIGNLTGCMIFEIDCYQECIFIKLLTESWTERFLWLNLCWI